MDRGRVEGQEKITVLKRGECKMAACRGPMLKICRSHSLIAFSKRTCVHQPALVWNS